MGEWSGEQGDPLIGRGAGANGRRVFGSARGRCTDLTRIGGRGDLSRWMLVVHDRLRGSAAVPTWSREGSFFVWVGDQTRSAVRKRALKAHWSKGRCSTSAVGRARRLGRGDRPTGALLAGQRSAFAVAL